VDGNRQLYIARKTVLTIAKCTETEDDFGLHLTQIEEGVWIMDYTFVPRPHAVLTENQWSAERVTGKFNGGDSDFEGCPHCGNRQMFRCDCEHISCFVTNNHDFEPFNCPWCGLYVSDFSNGWDDLMTRTGDY
jgi:hypothetical protein